MTPARIVSGNRCQGGDQFPDRQDRAHGDPCGFLDGDGDGRGKRQTESDFPQGLAVAEHLARSGVHPQASPIEHDDAVGGDRFGRILGDVDGGDLTLRGGWTLRASFITEGVYYPHELYADYATETPTNTGTDTIPYVGVPEIATYNLSLGLTLPRSQHFTGSTSLLIGQDVNYDEWASGYLFLWRNTLVWRPTEQLRVEGSFVRQQYLRRIDNSTLRIRDLPRLKIEYQFTRAIFFRFVGQYDATNLDDLRDDTRTGDAILIRDGDGVYQPALAWTSNDFRIDGLFSFEPSPGTVIFAGYGSSLTEDDSFRFKSLERVSDGFFVKLSYRFRM